jgi:hypothetical protein
MRKRRKRRDRCIHLFLDGGTLCRVKEEGCVISSARTDERFLASWSSVSRQASYTRAFKIRLRYPTTCSLEFNKTGVDSRVNCINSSVDVDDDVDDDGDVKVDWVR